MIKKGLLDLRKKNAIKNHKFPLGLRYTWREFAQQLSCILCFFFFGDPTAMFMDHQTHEKRSNHSLLQCFVF